MPKRKLRKAFVVAEVTTNMNLDNLEIFSRYSLNCVGYEAHITKDYCKVDQIQTNYIKPLRKK